MSKESSPILEVTVKVNGRDVTLQDLRTFKERTLRTISAFPKVNVLLVGSGVSVLRSEADELIRLIDKSLLF